MKKNKWLMFLLLVVVCNNIWAQGKILVNATIVDKNKQAIIGATVLEKGTSNGTVTNLNGQFSLTVNSPQAVLQISYVGFDSKELTVAEAIATKNIELLENAIVLNEVIAIGYGQVRKDDATGALTVLGEKSMNKSASLSPQQLIVGRMAGVVVTTSGGSPTDGAQIRIRGGSSMSASNDPLIIVDGLPMDNRSVDGLGNILNTINPNEIETFTVLKDASATAIYGSRASNGVIIITTKKGAKDQKLKVDYDLKTSFSTVARKVELLSADEFRNIVQQRHSDNANITSLLGNASTDWQDQIFRNSFGQDHNIGVSGAIVKIPFRASVGYTNQDGVVKSSNMKRTTATLRLNPSLFDNHLTFDFGAKGAIANNSFPDGSTDRGGIAEAMRMDPTQNPKSNDPQFDRFGGYFTWLLPNGERNVNGTRNPLANIDQRTDKAVVKRLTADFKADYKFHFLPDLRATFTAGIDYSGSNGEIRIDPKASWVELASASEAMVARDYTQNIRNETFNFVLNYRKNLSVINSDFDLMVGAEQQHALRKSSSYEVRANNSKLTDGSETEYYLASFFGRFNYTLANKYLLTATLRRDGSSRFSPATRWGLFPSVAFAWKMSEEDFMKNIDFIYSMKMRVGYGVTGQQELTGNDYPYMGTFRYSDVYSRYQFGNKFVTSIRPSGFDENIKWEETQTYNAGIDYALFKGRIYGSIDAYYRRTNDLINTIPVPAGSNFTDRLLTNIGNLENKGIELSANWIAVDNNKLTWEIGINASYNNNKVTKLTSYDDPNYVGVEVGNISGGNGNLVQVHAVGQALNTFLLYEQKYDENGRPIEGEYVDRNNDGEITLADKYYAKNPAPDWMLGYNTSFRYKNFDLSLAGRVSIGNYVYDDNASNGAHFQNLTTNNYLMNLNRDVLNTQFETPRYWSDYYLKNASFLKLDNITFGYNLTNVLPKVLGKNAGLRVYGSVQNVFVITQYKGVDPEIAGGIDRAFYPRPRTFVLGLSARF